MCFHSLWIVFLKLGTSEKKNEQKEIIEAITDEETREEVQEALSYPEHSAGRLMRTDMVTIEQGWSVG
ncbi:MAG: hypothetical protein ABL919_15680, partial [Methylococcales bacterium]